MIGKVLRKILVILVILLPVISYSDCKKQAKCGCGQDIQRSFTQATVTIYFNATKTLLYFMTPGDPYTTYNFCNPSDAIAKLTNVKSGDQLQVSGHAYWDCNFVYQSSNQAYQSLYQVFDVEETELFQDLYGKDKPSTGTTLESIKIQK